MDEINQHVKTVLIDSENSSDFLVSINESLEALERIVKSFLSSTVEFNKKLRSRSSLLKQFCNMELLVLILEKYSKYLGIEKIKNVTSLLLKGI